MKRAATPALDALGLLVAGFCASSLEGGRLGWIVAFSSGVLLILAARNQYRARVTASTLADLPSLLVSAAVAMAISLSLAYAFGGDDELSGLVPAFLVATIGLLLMRAALARARRALLNRGYGFRRTLICGNNMTAHHINDRLGKQLGLGLRPVAFASPQQILETMQWGVAGSRARTEEWLTSHQIEHVIVAVPPSEADSYSTLLGACYGLGVPVSYVAQGLERRSAGSEFGLGAGVPLLRITPHRPRVQVAIKHSADRVAAGVLLVLLSPLLVTSSVLILISMGRPIVFRQRRIGINGDEFEMLKFRSMRMVGARIPSEDDWDLASGIGPGGVEGADRRTRVGRFLRRTSLDELPQLVNVLRGEMSLVGPRPERPEYVRRFVREVNRYGERHRVRVGMTGLAQVQGLRGQTSLEDRIEMDNYYIDNWSLWLDAQILIRTVAAVVGDQPE